MFTNNQRSRSKEQFWRRMVRQWRRSGLSVRTFCEKHGLSEPSFYAWRRFLKEHDAAAVRFVPVQVTPEAQSAPAADSSAADNSAGALELLLGAGRRLRVGPGFDGPTLQRLLTLLEQGVEEGRP
jgi:transposase-like protein